MQTANIDFEKKLIEAKAIIRNHCSQSKNFADFEYAVMHNAKLKMLPAKYLKLLIQHFAADVY